MKSKKIGSWNKPIYLLSKHKFNLKNVNIKNVFIIKLDNKQI